MHYKPGEVANVADTENVTGSLRSDGEEQVGELKLKKSGNRGHEFVSLPLSTE